MSVFSTAVNAFNSTLSRAGKYYHSVPSRMAIGRSGRLAYAPKIGIGAAAGGALIGAASSDDHKTSAAIVGGVLGGALGLRRMRPPRLALGAGRPSPIGPMSPVLSASPSRLALGPGGSFSGANKSRRRAARIF